MAANNPTRCKCLFKVEFHVELLAKALWKRVDVTLKVCRCSLAPLRWKIYEYYASQIGTIDRLLRWAAGTAAVYIFWKILDELGLGTHITDIVRKIQLFLI